MAYRKFLPYNISGAVIWAAAVTLLGYFLGAGWEKAGRWIGRASALLGALLVFAFLLIWLWRWAAKNEVFIRRVWSRFLQRQTVKSLRARLAPQLAFVRARLSPNSYLGLQLTTVALLLIGASWLFGGVAEDVVHGDPLTLVDEQVAQWFHEHATPLVTQIMMAITDLQGPLPVSLTVVLIAIYLAWKRNWYWLICLMFTVPFGMLLNVLMKYSFHRARPSFADPLLVVSNYSFPSGHVAGATLLYGIVAVMLIAHIKTWRWRVVIVLGAITMVALVALTRMYHCGHYLSDVLAAFVEGVAWLTLCLTGMNTFWQHRADTSFAKKK